MRLDREDVQPGAAQGEVCSFMVIGEGNEVDWQPTPGGDRHENAAEVEERGHVQEGTGLLTP